MQVYLLINEVNGKYYVGKTVSKNLNKYLSVKRWAARHNKNLGMPLVRAMRKHGVENFSTSVLAKVDNPAQLLELEKVWIIALDSRNPRYGYNVCAGGIGTTGLACSEERKQKIGLANKGRTPKGYVRTEEHKRQLRERMKGNRRGVGHGRPRRRVVAFSKLTIS